MLKDTDKGVIEDIYYAVPGHYGYGPKFSGTPEGHRAAVAEAKSKIKLIGGLSEPRYTRAWIEKRFTIRWLPAADEIGAGIDTAVERREIFLTDAEKLEAGSTQ